MLLKRFEAPTLQDALEKVRTECGEDALLVETQETRRGFVVVASRPQEALERATVPRRSGRTHATPKATQAAPRWTPGFAPLAERAQAFGLSTTILRAIEKALIGTRIRVDRANDPALPRVAAKVLQGLIKTTEFPTPTGSGPQITAFVGPTGVGKTTTLAKIAAHAKRSLGERVAIVTIDTYRMAAVEQLRAMAEMLDTPFEVAFNPVDLRRAVQNFADYDRVMIDTTGRSPSDRAAIEALRATLHVCDPHVTLCLPASARRADADDTFSAFRGCGGGGVPDSIILTKWDETRMPGEALSLVVEQGLALARITLGQEIPDDIVDADPAAIAAAALARDEADMETLL